MNTVEYARQIYKVINGTHYDLYTSNKLVILLEDIRQSQTRVRFHWGNADTGLDWGDCHDVEGRIGRSTGPIKIPILLYNSRSVGGSAILTNCIVKIVETKGKRILYQHPYYHSK